MLHFWDCLDVEAIRAMQPGLRANRTLRELCLAFCDLDEERLRLLAHRRHRAGDHRRRQPDRHAEPGDPQPPALGAVDT